MASSNSTSVQHHSNGFDFIGSSSILSSVFDAIDQNVFNCNLDGIKLEWCDKLESRAAVTYQQATYAKKQVYIRCSKQWLQNCTRKQFMEAILYEMLDLYLSVNTSVLPIRKKNDGLNMYLLECAFRYLNQRFGTDLKINKNYTKDANHSDVDQILDSIASQRKISKKKASIDGFKASASMEILTKKLVGNSKDYKCTKDCIGVCYCGPQALFRHRFYGANIYAIFTSNENVKCLLCEKEMKPETMDAHLDNNCFVFQPIVHHALGGYTL